MGAAAPPAAPPTPLLLRPRNRRPPSPRQHQLLLTTREEARPPRARRLCPRGTPSGPLTRRMVWGGGGGKKGREGSRRSQQLPGGLGGGGDDGDDVTDSSVAADGMSRVQRLHTHTSVVVAPSERHDERPSLIGPLGHQRGSRELEWSIDGSILQTAAGRREPLALVRRSPVVRSEGSRGESTDSRFGAEHSPSAGRMYLSLSLSLSLESGRVRSLSIYSSIPLYSILFYTIYLVE
eukprot:GHVU01066853.1.p1 GENE.GHVU01066853.1~~GHVU01066853.1.p1  ORF type:complete len:236 (+),score=11.07 GHVU01066853.1:652-1359(+)